MNGLWQVYQSVRLALFPASLSRFTYAPCLITLGEEEREEEEKSSQDRWTKLSEHAELQIALFFLPGPVDVFLSADCDAQSAYLLGTLRHARGTTPSPATQLIEGNTPYRGKPVSPGLPYINH